MTAVNTLRELEDDALLKRSGEHEWRFHDLVQNVLSKLLVQAKPSGLGLPLKEAHQQLLARYNWMWTSFVLSELPNDGYIGAHLTWHFEMAGEFGAIHDLLKVTTQDGQNAWWHVLFARNQLAIFMADVEKALKYAFKEANPFPLLVRYTLIRSSLFSMGRIMSAGALLALVERRFWDFEQAFGVAKQNISESEAAYMFLGLLEIAVDHNVSSVTVKELWELATNMSHRLLRPNDRAAYLIRLLRVCPATEREELLGRINTNSATR